MKNIKKTAIYARSSSNKQSVELQIEAANPYIQGIDPKNVVYFTDEGISTYVQPKGLQRLIGLIAKDRVQTLIVSQRERLTRNVFEYLKPVDLIKIHKVKVVFAASAGSAPFGDIYSEGLYALMNKIERTRVSNV